MSLPPRGARHFGALGAWGRAVAGGLLCLVLTPGTSSAASGDVASVPSAQCLTATRAASVVQLLELTGVFERARTETAGVVERLRLDNPKVLTEFWKSFTDRVAARDVRIGLYVPIYTGHLSPEDVCVVLNFYRTPIGAYLIKVTPEIQQETRVAAQAWASNVAIDLLDPDEDSQGAHASHSFPPEPATVLAAGHVAAVHEFLKVSGTLAAAQQMMGETLDRLRQGPQASTLPASFWDHARKRLSEESDLLRLWTPAYANKLTETQTRELIRFYTSAPGARYVAALPVIRSESLNAGAQLGRDAAKRAVHEVYGPLPQWRMLHPPTSTATAPN